jgi:hypothetical protein
MSEFPGRLLVSDWWFPTAADFRKDPRFAELMRTVGLLDFWQQNGWPDLCQPSGNSLRCQ